MEEIGGLEGGTGPEVWTFRFRYSLLPVPTNSVVGPLLFGFPALNAPWFYLNKNQGLFLNPLSLTRWIRENVRILYYCICINFVQNLFKQQQKLFQQQRIVQSQRLNRIRQLLEEYSKGWQDLQKCHLDHRTNVQDQLRKEMNALQKKILIDTVSTSVYWVINHFKAAVSLGQI